MKLSAGFVLFFCLPGFAANRFDIGHLDKLRRVADPQFSPDGKSIVVVVSRPNYSEDRYDAELVLVEVPGGRTHMLTHDRRAVSSPRWSPSGDRLAFLSTGANAKSQIYVMPMTGGDAVQITRSVTGIQQFTWRPDGKMIAFAASDEPPEEDRRREIQRFVRSGKRRFSGEGSGLADASLDGAIRRWRTAASDFRNVDASHQPSAEFAGLADRVDRPTDNRSRSFKWNLRIRATAIAARCRFWK